MGRAFAQRPQGRALTSIPTRRTVLGTVARLRPLPARPELGRPRAGRAALHRQRRLGASVAAAAGAFAVSALAATGRAVSRRERVGFSRSRLIAVLQQRGQQEVLQIPLQRDPVPRDTARRADAGLADILQFDSAVYYVDEREGELVAEVIRFGRTEERCSVKYRTEHTQKYATHKYIRVEGELVFERGELCKTLRVPIVQNSRWEPVVEFRIQLYAPHKCELGRYLHVARVKVLDSDYFPTNSFMEKVQQLGSKKSLLRGTGADLGLLLDYFKMNYDIDGVREKTWAHLAIDQLPNLYFLLTTYMVKYITDEVLNPTPNAILLAGNPDMTLLFVGALYVIPYALMYFFTCKKAELQLAEELTATLQSNIFHKVIYLGESTLSKVPVSQVMILMVKDASEIASSGYMKMLEIAKNIGRLAISVAFILSENPDALLLLLFFSVAIAVFSVARYRETVVMTERLSDAEGAVVDVVQNSWSNYKLIRDYLLRPQVEEKLEDGIDDMKKCSVPMNLGQVAADYFPSGLSTILLAAYVPFGGQAVLDGSLQIGVFLATLNIINDMGQSYSAILTAIFGIIKAVAPVSQLVWLMNQPSALPDMNQLYMRRRQRTKELRTPAFLDQLRDEKTPYASDAIPITLNEVSFTYKTGSREVIDSVSLEVPQGRLVALVGTERGGKATLLKLLGQVLQPTAGFIFVPSYLRVLHVSPASSTLLRGGLWRNLAVGQVYWADKAFELDRAIRICRRVGFREELMQVLEGTRDAFLESGSDPDDPALKSSLTLTDRVLISLARAFIFDPEVLVLNRPTVELPVRIASRVMSLLREFVDQRGLEIPNRELAKRRPRTAFASFVRPSDAADAADAYWAVEGGHVTEISREEATLLY